MDYNGFAEKYSPYLRQYFIPLILGVLGLIFLGYGMIAYFGQKKDKQDILFEAASTSSVDDAGAEDVVSDPAKNKQQKMIVVDIEGAVEKPGVYKVVSGSRMQDGLIAAGGLGRGADRELVAKNLNLATKLIDGMKIYIPSEGEKPPQSPLSGGGDMGGLVNINSVSASELDTLPGIGKVTADKIISNRPYETIESLVEKKIVGQKVFDQIKDKIVAQ